MRPVVSLLARSTLATIRTSLKETGQARCDLTALRVDVAEWRKLARQAARDLGLTALRVDVAEWRKLARQAARDLGRTVQTVEADAQVVAVLRDWPQNDEERAVTLSQMRKTIDAIQHPGT